MIPERYSDAQLSEAFDLVADEDDWKLPICKIVPAGTDLDLIYDAVVYYTGSMACFEEQADGSWLVTGDGYYLNMVA